MQGVLHANKQQEHEYRDDKDGVTRGACIITLIRNKEIPHETREGFLLYFGSFYYLDLLCWPIVAISLA